LIFVLNTIYARSRRTLADGVSIRQKLIGVQFCDISWFRRSSI
jgi:outer membrane PBP1 activator LpoA protein